MPRKAPSPKVATSIRLTLEAKRLLTLLAQNGGISEAAWMETAIRREAKRQGIQGKQSEGSGE
jgi:hypothetical protein